MPLPAKSIDRDFLASMRIHREAAKTPYGAATEIRAEINPKTGESSSPASASCGSRREHANRSSSRMHERIPRQDRRLRREPLRPSFGPSPLNPPSSSRSEGAHAERARSLRVHHRVADVTARQRFDTAPSSSTSAVAKRSSPRRLIPRKCPYVTRSRLPYEVRREQRGPQFSSSAPAQFLPRFMQEVAESRGHLKIR